MGIATTIVLAIMIFTPAQEIDCDCDPLITVEGNGVNIGKFARAENHLGYAGIDHLLPKKDNDPMIFER